MSITPLNRLTQGYAALSLDTRPRRDLAATWRPDDRMEALAGWRETHPDRWEKLDPTTRLAVGHYVAAKAAYEAELAAQQEGETNGEDEQPNDAA